MSDLVQKIAAIYEPLLAKCVDADDREKLREAIRQALGSTQERGEVVERRSFVKWHRVEDGLPDSSVWNKVLVYTDGVDFGGEQFFHIRAQSLYPSDGDYDNEIAEAATHWSPAPFPSASAAPAVQERGEAVEQIAAAIADEAAQEWWVDLGGSRVHYRTANWAALRMAQELGRAHPTPDAGRLAELEAELSAERKDHLCSKTQAHARIAAIESQLTASREREGRMRAYLRERGHSPGCESEFGPAPCNCGYRAALAAEKE